MYFPKQHCENRKNIAELQMKFPLTKKFNVDFIRKTNFCIKNSNTNFFKMTKNVNMTNVRNSLKNHLRINTPIKKWTKDLPHNKC